MLEHNEKTKVFFTIVDGYKAFVAYEIKNDILDITTTQVPKVISGRGIASVLVKACVEYANEKKLVLRNPLSCSYAQTWIERH